MKYEIYQLEYSSENSNKLFASWDFLNKHFGGFNFNEYKKVYEGDVEDSKDIYTILDNIFTTFNLNHPNDFHGHSLSVSDVVLIDGIVYYCDSVGWKDVFKLYNESRF